MHHLNRSQFEVARGQIVVDVEDICEDELTPARQLGGRVRAQGGGGLHVRAGARRA